MANDTGTKAKKLYRYPDKGPLGGVCAGIAEYFELDANLVRLGTIILAVVGPGIPAYILAWIFLPEADGTIVASSFGPGRGKGNRFSQVVGIVLIIIAISVLWGDWWWPGRGWVLPLGLIAFGGWLLFKTDDDDDEVPVPPGGGTSPWGVSGPTATSVAPAPPVPPAGATEADSADTTDVAAADGDDATDTLATRPLVAPPGGGDGDGPPTAELPAQGPPPPPPKARRRRVLGPLVFGALLLWGGLAWLAGMNVEDGLAVGLCILGAGFVLGAFIGGSKALVLPALLIATALVCVSVIDIPLHGGIGDRTWTVTSVRELEDHYELAIGEATLDLSDLDAASGRVPDVDIDLGIGHLEVIVPQDATVVIDAKVGAGELDVLGRSDDGMSVELQRTFRGDDGGDRFDIDVHLGLGDVEVRRAER